MKIGLIQLEGIPGDISANVQKHLEWAEKAFSAGAEILFFPELSLSGYWPEKAEALAFSPDDLRLKPFQNFANLHKVVLCPGFPLKTDTGVQIAMAIFQPHQPVRVYAKRLLHEDEWPFFEAGSDAIFIENQGKRIVPGICFETMQPQFEESAQSLGADVLLASVAKTEKGMLRAQKFYAELAKRTQKPVLMVNAVGNCAGFETVGKSAFWDGEGILRESMGMEVGLMVAEF